MVLALSTGVVGCSDDDAGPPRPPVAEVAPTTASSVAPGDGPGNKATIAATEYAYSVQGSISEGLSTIELANGGNEYHMATFTRLNPGATLDQAAQAFASEDQEAFARLAADGQDAPGAPGTLVGPGARAVVTTPFLKPGRYALACFVPGPDGVVHVAKGMIAELEVTTGAPPAPPPAAAAELTIADGAIQGAPSELKAGTVTFKAINGGKGPHELGVARLESGKTIQDLDRYFTTKFEEGVDPGGPPPGEVLASVFDFPPAEAVYLTVELRPGTYFLGCTYSEDEGPDPKDHIDLAEHVTVTVT